METWYLVKGNWKRGVVLLKDFEGQPPGGKIIEAFAEDYTAENPQVEMMKAGWIMKSDIVRRATEDEINHYKNRYCLQML